jgi:surface protein
MKDLHNYIFEKLNLKDIKRQYSCCPKTKDELKQILEERLKENKNADLNDINVSEITDMNHLFAKLDPHDINISKWDVSNVTNTSFMFFFCENFNCNLSELDVSKVTNMQAMFTGCHKLDTDLNKWDVSNVEEMYDMFFDCKSIDKPKWYENK